MVNNVEYLPWQQARITLGMPYIIPGQPQIKDLMFDVNTSKAYIRIS
jgi:hypothetical protein